MVVQQKTGRPVQFEITADSARAAPASRRQCRDYAFPTELLGSARVCGLQ